MRLISASLKLGLTNVGLPAFVALVAIVKLFAGRRRSRRQSSLPSLRAALVGSTRRQVAEILGSPRTTMHGETETWYYPVDSDDRLAMAVSFEGNRARSVEFFSARVPV